MTLNLMSFFYTVNGDGMTVYVDGVLFLNLAFDFLLLLTTAVVLKRNVKIFNILLGAFIGSFSTLVLFLNITSLQLFIIKVYLSILMVLFTFYYKDFKYFMVNLGTLYLVSLLLGGFLYFLNIEFSYKHDGLVFYHDAPSVNVLFLLIISPIILYIYIRQCKYLSKKIKNYYKVTLIVGKQEFLLNGYLDTGNTLSYKGDMVILTNLPNTFRRKKVLVPYVAINGSGVIECIKAKVIVDKLGEYDVWLGFSENINISGVDVLLNGKMEGKI